jgi:hypothetical protein
MQPSCSIVFFLSFSDYNKSHHVLQIPLSAHNATVGKKEERERGRGRGRGRDLAKSELVVVLVIEHMQEIRVKGMDALEARELLNDGRELLMEVLLGEPNLAHVELAQARDCIALVHHRRRLPLCARQDYVHHFLPRRHHRYPLEIVLHHLFLLLLSGDPLL